MRGQENFAKPPLSAQRARSASAIARSRKCGQTGEILGLNTFAELTTPSAALRWLRGFLFMAAATPPFQGGECRPNPNHSPL